MKWLEIENQKWKWKKILENSRETRISLVSVSTDLCPILSKWSFKLSFKQRKKRRFFVAKKVKKLPKWRLGGGINLDNTQKKRCFFLGYLPKIYLVLSSKLARNSSYWLLCLLTPESSKTPRHRRPVQRHRRGHLEVFLGTLLASRSVWGTGFLKCVVSIWEFPK